MDNAAFRIHITTVCCANSENKWKQFPERNSTSRVHRNLALILHKNVQNRIIWRNYEEKIMQIPCKYALKKKHGRKITIILAAVPKLELQIPHSGRQYKA